MTVYTPANSLQPIRFCALVGTDADIRENVIWGRWKDPAQTLYGLHRGRLLVEEFLNWPSDSKSVLTFIRRFGPLYENAHSPVKEFGVNLVFWPRWKESIRRVWEDLMEGPHDFEFHSDVDDALLSYTNRGFELRVAYLRTFLDLELASCDRRRLRKCLAPDCATPYFVARHLRQRYCDEKCAKWAQSGWKKQWWADHGREWRKKHSKS